MFVLQKKKPIIEGLERFRQQQNISFHVPGHKHGELSHLPQAFKDVMRYDVTELSGLDDLHYPEEMILEAEHLLADTYGAMKSFFLVGGSTVGNLAMIYATCQKGDTIIVQRNAHKSIFHAIELVGAKPIFVSPIWDERTLTATHVTFLDLKEAVENYSEAKAVVLTYPTYYGVTSNEIQQQITYCHEKGIPVLVDEAHGAHFQACSLFQPSALSLGADVVVQSAHKTLPAMTMASFMHVRSELIGADKIHHYLRMLQSSSPSYVLLASLDDARYYVQTYMESDGAYIIEKRNQWIEALRSIGSLDVIEVDDPLKLLLRVKGYSGFQLQEALEAKQVYGELADRNQVLFILPLLKQGHTYPFAEIRVRIKEAVTLLLEAAKTDNIKASQTAYKFVQLTEPVYTFDEMASLNKEWLPYMRTIGRISASMIIPYPPGIPLLVPGERITVAKLSQLEELLAAGATFQGNHRLTEKMIQVIK
ncbi:aminotransferase class I/II-fold pyridoxal phosphate-dependent enzyme [Lysinibacillus sp. fkY74-1]|uniref:aminotransferase class I/II-fold pyridoxal phosphate-dependent enzyme n=1 Tax=Lysinibacillus TaxID=400634 RepID=UPI00056846BC|nr:aminotransferase class I/II-fold pyridoxal phosphate-dependent enzyme [Lysinibacillus sphaericus]MBI6864481.1 aminotransferase class I/II-fold pyridoxal phosphate-dependent enzyme [Lysinibacillus fusiformis]MBG9692199.1 lysine decarboxylase [Lysinibacillus sphaericus]MBG9756058.1 lysine decarboxylase [Lysinibacillus sphaericus]MDM5353307.1 aminotransferase class I/II-fold pyridoxal phosphate-dependent enzyme [Lysinibacillus sphaericus]PIJ95789.1 lysine decarboxylase [Lysinibacillus sphaeric